MYDFESIISGHHRRSPLGARKKFQISLDGQPIGGEPQMSDQLSDAHPLRHFARLAIDLYSHHLAHNRVVYRVGRLGFSW